MLMLNIDQEINRYVKDKSRFSCKGGGIMDKEEFTLLENIKRLDNDMQKEVKVKETKIKILEAEIEQLYEFIAKIQHLGEIEQQRLVNLESKDEE